MASLDRRLNPLYAIKECSSCGALYTTDYCCSKRGLVDKIICDLNKTPDSSQQPPPIVCAKCGYPVDGPYYQGCALLQKKFKEDLFTYCVKNGIFQDLQDTSESSNNNTNVVNAPQEPFVMESFVNDALVSLVGKERCSLWSLLYTSSSIYLFGTVLHQGGPHATFECQPMNQNFHDFGFDQFQPPQSPVIHQPPQEMSMEAFQAREELTKSIENFLKMFNRISFQKTPKVLMQAWDKFLEIKHAQSEDVQELLNKLVDDVQNSEDECECDVPDCDDSQTTNFLTFSNPLFYDSTSSDDESSHEEVIHEMNFKTYSNPLFDLEKEINSSEFNPTHNEDLDSTPKDVRFDAESYLLESLVNRDTLMASPPKIDFLLDEFAGELTRLKSIPPGIDNINLDPEGDILFLESLLYDNSSPRPPEAFQANSNTIIESLPISVDALREEIDILHGPDDSIPPGIESDDFDSEDDDNSTSLPEFESFHVDYPDSGDSTIVVVEDIPMDVPNILPTYPALQLDFDFIPSNDLGSDLDVSSASGDRNKIYDPGICIEVESTRSCYSFPRD
ncbi:hypothetical protein Tco_1356562 [Tanacetum coccineum]